MEKTINIDQFLKGYIASALWSTTDCYDEEGSETYNLDDEFDNVSPNCRKAMQEDCRAFIRENEQNLIEFKALADCDNFRLGFLFWLNREGHGSGYWDELTNGETIGDTLSDACQRWGEFPLYGDFEKSCVCSHHYG